MRARQVHVNGLRTDILLFGSSRSVVLVIEPLGLEGARTRLALPLERTLLGTS